MVCTIKRTERGEFVQLLVLKTFREMEGEGVVVTLDTMLGPLGLGHTPTKRKFYYKLIKQALNDTGSGCVMLTMKPSDFADATKKTVGAIAAMVEKDLG